MKILFDMGHPAHVHFFKNAIWECEKLGHDIKITARDKDVTLSLLKGYNLDFISRGTGGKSIVQKGFDMTKITRKILKVAKEFKPDITAGILNPYTAQISKFIDTKSITFTDTENAKIAQKLTFPFTDHIVTPKCYQLDHGKKHTRYDGYHELAYLHPNWFESDQNILNELGVNKDEKFVIIRFVSWQASHDIAHKGITPQNKLKVVEEFSKHARVFITSEEDLPDALKKYQISIPPNRIHHALSYASMLYGESSTMASECAVLGTPAIYLDNDSRGYTLNQEKRYGAVFNFTESQDDQKRSMLKGIELLKNDNLKRDWALKRDKILEDNIDVTKYMVSFMENCNQESNS